MDNKLFLESLREKASKFRKDRTYISNSIINWNRLIDNAIDEYDESQVKELKATLKISYIGLLFQEKELETVQEEYTELTKRISMLTTLNDSFNSMGRLPIIEREIISGNVNQTTSCKIVLDLESNCFEGITDYKDFSLEIEDSYHELNLDYYLEGMSEKFDDIITSYDDLIV